MKFLSLLLVPALAAAQDITISKVQYSGNGCPQGTVSTSISSDKTVVTLGFDGFQTYIGPGTSIKDRTKNCQIHLTLSYPAGYSFAVVDSTYHGYAQLEAGVTGTFFSQYYFSSDASNTCTTQSSIAGGGVWADGQVYTKQDVVPTPNYVKSKCGQTEILNVNNRVALSSTDTNAFGQLTDDDATVDVSQQVHIAWFKC
ncbi:hypothetical protein KVR01_010313 [Diaporthe batatas]|uniref:uncharacterized protein n=1 Tax=Diaporthe batatas TaxID=748121 RepID=UPI001D04669F|nr:uncharacterized protein KVR01_010313 [Diaporthe batatas]KAG8159676.1 hypothetical protein KVR01_010313 [Diaporthe batatas]